ncbi:flagellar basal body P-ring formation chaperone FlgA [Pseudomonas sp. LS44]|uniref:flagellar basal body P-ring formation chaperone FlgA n=1 Tax=Pseudomonas sp. LS44 TaxID=1357074 RepID=UPI00215AC9D1|nr:flagellar basal body P-ring formation chaperone FlgA [Pseudomonas sp. LS44]UVE16399.1 flagellar basal body P-ring formation chaperone FlgA [Pseudomonas sp. LS44]
MNQTTTIFRRVMAKSRNLILAALPALPGFGYSAMGHASTTPPELLIGATQGFLEFTVEDYLQRSEIQGRYEIEVNRLDPRLRMPLCDEELSASLESPAQPLGRVTVKLRCEGAAPWSLFVPAQVRLYREVLIVTRPLKRNGVVDQGDIALVERDVGLLNQGYLTTPEQALGKKLTRPLQPDQVLAPAHLQMAEAIRKGDQVVINARSGSINVRMAGEALSDGSEGAQIRVRNLASQRVIKARVAGPGQVDVAM